MGPVQRPREPPAPGANVLFAGRLAMTHVRSTLEARVRVLVPAARTPSRHCIGLRMRRAVAMHPPAPITA